MDKKKKVAASPSHHLTAPKKQSGPEKEGLTAKHMLQDYKYDGSNAVSKCSFLSEVILAAVKDQSFDRYKYIVQVFMVEKTGQSIYIASRWVWDAARDNWVSALHETENYVTVALIIAGYYE